MRYLIGRTNNCGVIILAMLSRDEVSSSLKGRGAWAAVSTAGIALSWLVSVTFPYFSTVMAIIAALGDLAGAYALPALFVLVRAFPPHIFSSPWQYLNQKAQLVLPSLQRCATVSLKVSLINFDGLKVKLCP